ncbi:2,3,4,5-tetrahydropyridine-2,6-dicarboxylate N-acetyltransferase, partial [Dysosmobacter welbionis]
QHGAADVRQGVGAAHSHGVGQLGLQLFHIGLDALGTGTVHHGDEGPADQHRVRAQGQGLEHVHAGADAAVHQNGHPAAHSVHDGGQHLCGRGALIQHPAAVVGHHDALGPGLQSFLGPGHGHDALDDEGLLRHGNDLAQLLHSLAAGGGRHVLQEGQARRVDVHGDGKGICGLHQVHLLPDGLQVPGLDGGHAAAAVLGDGRRSALHDRRVRAVAGEGGDARFSTGGHQDVVIG